MSDVAAQRKSLTYEDLVCIESLLQPLMPMMAGRLTPYFNTCLAWKLKAKNPSTAPKLFILDGWVLQCCELLRGEVYERVADCVDWNKKSHEVLRLGNAIKQLDCICMRKRWKEVKPDRKAFAKLEPLA